MSLRGRFRLGLRLRFGLGLGIGAEVKDLRVLLQPEFPGKPAQVVVLNRGLLKEELSRSRHLLTN